MKAIDLVENAVAATPVKKPVPKVDPKTPGKAPRPGTAPHRAPGKTPGPMPRPKGKKKGADVASAPGKVTRESLTAMAQKTVTTLLDGE